MIIKQNRNLTTRSAILNWLLQDDGMKTEQQTKLRNANIRRIRRRRNSVCFRVITMEFLKNETVYLKNTSSCY